MVYYSKIKHITLILAISILLSSCAANKHEKPILPVEVPKNWTSESSLLGEYPNSNWEKEFNDSKLTQLIKEVLENNYDLQITAANLESAAAQAKKAGADLSPKFDINAQAMRSDNQANSKTNVKTFGVSLDISWEADVWGRISSGKKAAQYDYYAAEYDYKAAKQSLAAQTAKAYFLSIETTKQLLFAEDYKKNLQKTVKVTEAFHEVGLLSIQDVYLAKADLSRASESVQNKKSANLNALRSLEVLLGRYPIAKVDTNVDFPVMPKVINAGIPSDILEFRPDIRAAERRVAAAFNRINESRAAKLPTILLTGSLGASSSDLRTLTDPINQLWNIAGGILFPIFNTGKLNAEIDIKTAEQKSAIASYQKTALMAFLEVEKSLSNEALYRTRQQNLNDAYKNSLLAESIADENFLAGNISLLDLLQIKRNTVTIKGDMLHSERELLDQRVNLNLSLGL